MVLFFEWYLMECFIYWWLFVSGRWLFVVFFFLFILVEIFFFWVDGYLISEYKLLVWNSFVICGFFLKGLRKRMYMLGRIGVFKIEVWFKDVF